MKKVYPVRKEFKGRWCADSNIPSKPVIVLGREELQEGFWIWKKTSFKNVYCAMYPDKNGFWEVVEYSYLEDLAELETWVKDWERGSEVL